MRPVRSANAIAVVTRRRRRIASSTAVGVGVVSNDDVAGKRITSTMMRVAHPGGERPARAMEPDAVLGARGDHPGGELHRRREAGLLREVGDRRVVDEDEVVSNAATW